MRPNKKDERILRKFPQIKELVIKFCRDPDIEALVENVRVPKRQSVRLMKLTLKQNENVVVTGNQTPNKKHSPVKGKSVVKMPPKQRTPTTRKSSNAAIFRSGPAKSILKVAGKRCGIRSKSVSFDFSNGSPKRSNMLAVRRTLFNQNTTQVDNPFSSRAVADSNGDNEVPIDLTTGKMPILMTSANITTSVSTEAPVSDEVAGYAEIEHECSGESDAPTGSLSSGEILAFENRINGLVEANRSKVRRIKELLAERSTLLGEVENVHRLNRLLTETVDIYRQQDENDQPLNGNNVTSKLQQQVDRLQDDIASLRDRIKALNRENFDLNEENKKLKTVVGTFSKKALSEHNYNL